MPLGRGIVEVFEAIPDRIEVSGHEPIWKVTGGSFDGVLAFAREAYGETAVIGREDRSRWWPRVTLTITTDPDLMARAPAQEVFADPVEPEERDEPEPAPPHLDDGADVDAPSAEDESFVSSLDEIFAHQEALRMARRRIPQQRSSG
jgi:hypothetical protein